MTPPEDQQAGSTAEAEAPDTQDAEAAKEPLKLDVKIEARSACERHVTVTIPQEDVERYFKEAFDKLMPEAQVPGFRAGRAPRKLVETRFRKEVQDQIKGSLLVDAFGQINEDHDLTPISEPDFDPDAVVVPDSGPMTFEFDIEVRPEFQLPKWKGLSIERPVREFSGADIDTQLRSMLAQYGKLVPHEGAAGPGDYVTCNLSFRHDGQEISGFQEETIRLRPVLSFRDGRIEGFDKLMKGAKSGDTREGKAELSEDAPNEALRGKTVDAVFKVLEVKKLEMPELSPKFLEEVGGFQSEDELREAVRSMLSRRLEYQQQRMARQQILAQLTVAADWDLPPELLKRQSRRELERSILELRRSGFSEQEIRAHANELLQNSRESTARALKEHFILERIAEEEKIEDTPEDYDVEISLIAQQSGESVRRVRAQLEKRNLMDTLRNQIIERKTIELILSHAKFKDVPYQLETSDAEALDRSAGGGDESDIPVAQHPDEPAKEPNR